MKAIINTIIGGLLPWKVKLNKINAYRAQANEKPPLRAELFSADQMERHGITLADIPSLVQPDTSPISF